MANDPNQKQGGTIDLRTSQTGSSTTGGATNPPSDDSSGSQSQFDIPEVVKQQYPDLIPLILKTESMTDEERQYWFQILPIMTDEQVKKLRDILANEKKQLEALDKEYTQELNTINEKHVSEWKEFELKQKRDELKAKESATKAQEKATEDTLLTQLQNL